ncbi:MULTISPECIES: HAD family hydrolase [Nocardiaceae]|uniref:Cof subfamily protein (Haloacid dehalogenase superfamily) n=1 Tax=Rhodococcoides corynebacterioides TaxID=53972 RepID=A0ABS2KVI1_9NOCA|nr:MULTISPECIES: HAD family hydrolase [Rhodococcus]MBM7415939.1 Cof subfamily protein (haloacid dehalogenase superfamily) [Rhodococcus corynebacterioides]MBP1118401.1 Cof subfamily protein (haloacid dehalogenase superfamily) [Rhodococcus sp. PvP016]
MTVRLFATDLDGTLLRSDRTISARTADAMAAARDAGIDVVWATARARHSVHEFAEQSGFRGIAVCANGAVLIDLADGTPVIIETVGMDVAVGQAAVDRVRTLVPGTVVAAVGPTSFVAETGYAALCVFSDHHRDPSTMDISSTTRFPWLREDMVKIVARHATVPSVDLYRALLAGGVDDVSVTHSGAPYVEIAARGVSKATALAALCERRGIARRDVAAAGDARNDLEMLAWAGTAICPSNAIPEVQALVDRVVASHDDDGIAEYLEELAHPRAGQS